MRLLEFVVKGYKNLKDIRINFEKSNGKTLVVGTNGSGKSNLLEALSSIFSATYNMTDDVSPHFEFELKYAINERTTVLLHNADGLIKLYCQDFPNGNDYKVVDKADYDKYLPDHVIAVYSGEEQRLWENYYYQSYDVYNKQYMDGKSTFRPQQMIYLNHYYWEIIASILSIHEIEEYRHFISRTIGIKEIAAIHMAFDVSKIKRNRNERARHILEILNPTKTSHLDISLETYIRVREFCGYEPDMFYNMVVLTLYKDYKIITDLAIKCSNGIEIKDLSEGEKKLLLIYGAINLLSGNNLYLLDEPDAHLHEGRKREIFDIIEQDKGSHFIISSHSPTLTKMFNASNVLLIECHDGACQLFSGEVSSTISKLTDGEWSYIEQSILFDASRPLLIVEGSGDVDYINKAIELLSVGNEEYRLLNNIDILHAGGAGNVKSFMEELEKFIPNGKEIIVLFDRDQAGGEGLMAIINKGKKGRANNDMKTYRKGTVSLLKLPIIQGFIGSDFVIEDYFSVALKKSIAQDELDNSNGDFSGFPNNIKEVLKRKLHGDLQTYTAKTMAGFSVLLDKLVSILTGKEKFTTI